MDKAAASFDVFAVSPQGFECHFQLNGEKVYQEAGKLLATMEKDGYKPKPTNGNHKGNGAGSIQEEGKVCPVHNATLKRHENAKGTWYSHKLADGSYCNGKAN